MKMRNKPTNIKPYKTSCSPLNRLVVVLKVNILCKTAWTAMTTCHCDFLMHDAMSTQHLNNHLSKIAKSKYEQTASDAQSISFNKPLNCNFCDL